MEHAKPFLKSHRQSIILSQLQINLKMPYIVCKKYLVVSNYGYTAKPHFYYIYFVDRAYPLKKIRNTYTFVSIKRSYFRLLGMFLFNRHWFFSEDKILIKIYNLLLIFQIIVFGKTYMSRYYFYRMFTAWVMEVKNTC